MTIFYLVLYSVFRQMVRLLKSFSLPTSERTLERTSQNVSQSASQGCLPIDRVVRPSWRGRSRSGAYGLALTLALLVTSCATAPQEDVAVEPAPSSTPSIVAVPKQTPPAATGVTPDQAQPTPIQSDGQADKKPPATSELISVPVYTIDSQCNDFVEKMVEVHSDKALAEAVGEAMRGGDYNAFKIQSYEVNMNGTTAVVDMALAPNSERRFVSLSSCEQRSLFGSIEKTLLDNPDWDVDAVKFTSNGQELAL